MTPLGSLYLLSRHRGWTLSHSGVIALNWTFLHCYSKSNTISQLKVGLAKFEKWASVIRVTAVWYFHCLQYLNIFYHWPFWQLAAEVAPVKGVKRHTSNKLLHMKNHSFLVFLIFASSFALSSSHWEVWTACTFASLFEDNFQSVIKAYLYDSCGMSTSHILSLVHTSLPIPKWQNYIKHRLDYFTCWKWEF